jgi:bifunctional DNase/RNase
VSKIKLEIIGLSASQSQHNSFALILGEQGRNGRRLPVIIGMFEAQAIAIEIEKIPSSRPMTHDLFKSFARHLSFDITEINISDLREGVFYAEIVMIDRRDNRKIVIGLRFDAPIYTYEHIMQEAGISLTEIEQAGDEEEREEVLAEKEEKTITEEDFSKMASDVLENLLGQAIENENYERAAKIRDELSRRGK